MKLRDILTKETWNKYGDMDVANDCIDEMAPAWCGTLLTKEGKEVFADVLDLDAEIEDDYIVVKVDHLEDYEKAWLKACRFFDYMAGYCLEEDYETWFTHEEEPDDPKEAFVRNYLSPMMVAAGVGIKDIAYYKHDNVYIDENYRTHYNEELVVTYNNGFTRLINVGCSSLAAMVEDLYKQGGVY